MKVFYIMLAAGAVALLIVAIYFLFSRPCCGPICSAGCNAAYGGIFEVDRPISAKT